MFLSLGTFTAFADHSEIHVSIGSAGQEEDRCTKTDCFEPNSVTIDQGSVVVFSNVDTLAHTVTSGSNQNGPDGKFDTGLLQSGTSYEVTFETPGDYSYFCMVHPWTIGNIVVLIDRDYSDDDHDYDRYEDENDYDDGYDDIPSSSYEPTNNFDVSEYEEKISELTNENSRLHEKIGQLEEEIIELEEKLENLNQLIYEQIQVIYTWVVGK